MTEILVTNDQTLEDDDAEGPLWATYYDPATPGQIVCNETSNSRVHAVLAILLFGAGYYISTQLQFDDPRDDLFVYAVRGIFPALGLVFLVLAIVGFVRMRKFGATTLSVKDNFGTLGSNLSGTIRSSVELKPKSNYIVSLKCIQSITRHTDERSTTQRKTLWSDNVSIPFSATSSKFGIPFTISIPNHLPQSGSGGRDENIRWWIEITAPTSGLNFKAKFLVPVLSGSSQPVRM